MVKRVCSISFFVSIMMGLHAQDTLSWDILSKVDWTEQKDTLFNLTKLTAEFHPELLGYDDQEIIIGGYVIPLDALGLEYALSKYSYAACFFCGKAGPETVLELKVTPRSIPAYHQKEKMIHFRGVLELKANADMGFNYILKNAIRLDDD